MKKFLIAASAAMFALSSQAHGDDHHAESSPTSGAKVAAGHDHEHGHGDAIGVAGRADKVTRTVTVEMTDSMRFTPASFTAKQGETIRFKVKNSGQLKHEFVLGTEKELKEHYELMKKFPEMEHSDSNMVTVAPGQFGEVMWQFTKAGKIDFACLQPGHYDAGMKGAVNVAATKGAALKEAGHGDHQH
ncbi:MAG: cupredoxin family protein [Burkholderiaceae bacterium]|nr:cupredoxin family protein [Burkholderiaceae bacterium]